MEVPYEFQHQMFLWLILNFIPKNQQHSSELKNIFLKAENHELKSIIQTVSDPMVSGDFNHNPHSSIIDLSD